MKLKNKKIVVFGGTSGIGLETIKLLLQNGASKVYAISRNPKKVKIRKKQLVLEKADVLDEGSLKALFFRLELARLCLEDKVHRRNLQLGPDRAEQ